MSNENTGNLLANPLPIVMVVLLAAGVLIKQVPLQSARPNDPERVKFVPAGRQDVEARLWQDPFAAVEKQEGRSKPKTHTPEALREVIRNKSNAGAQVRIIAASVFGGSYSEAAESRRRARFAVLSALGFHGYSPANPDAIGYFRIKLPGARKDVTSLAPGGVALDFNLVGPAGSGMLAELVRRTSEPDSVDLIVPYEWFERDKSSSHVLVLWLHEDKLTSGPREKLRSLILKLTPPPASSQLKTLNGAKRIPAEPLSDTLKIFVPSATIPSCDLDGSKSLKPWDCFMEKPPLLNELTNLSIVRTIGSDDVLATGLLWELWQRGVNRNLYKNTWLTGTPAQLLWELWQRVDLAYKDTWLMRKMGQLVKDPASFRGHCADGLVLISEWDSEYARALSRNLSEGFSARCKVDGGASPPVRQFSYLRGLDGMLPDVDKSSANASRKEEDGKSKDLRAQLEEAPPEHADGRSHYDYLRRLGDEIARLDGDDRQFAKHGIKAIGIVGSDVYDKLLILQALRSRFKDKIFFTTDLDARYLHADQKDWARNLVVASNFDLSLHPALQKSTAPFRDGYQTATYLAALMALEDKTLDYWTGKMKEWLRPQIFEIGRTGAVHLASPSVDDLKKWIESNYLDGSASAAENPCDDNWVSCKNIEPERPLRGLSPEQLLAIVLMILLGILSLTLMSRHLQQTAYDALNSAIPAEARAAKLWLIGAAALVLTMIATVVAVYFAVNATFGQGGEPFVWLEGISVWPSLVLRFAGLITMVALVLGFTIWIRREADFISERFDLPMPQNWKLARSRWSAVLTGPHLDLASFGPDGKAIVKPANSPVKIASLWQNYLRATGWREKWAWIVAAMMIVVLLSSVPFYLFGRPSFPHRGQFVETLHHILMMPNVLFFWLVIFWVGYEIRACARFIEILSDVPSAWPKSLLDRKEAETGVPRAHLDDYLDFQLIVFATRRIHWLIYLPFVFLLVLVFARSSLFDAMDFPLALIFVTGLAIAYALYTAVLLRRSAEAARVEALSHYDKRFLKQARPKDSPPPATGDAAAANPTSVSAEQIKLLMERIRSTREGAFASFTQQPALQALLLPFGGYGGVQLVEYLINL